MSRETIDRDGAWLRTAGYPLLSPEQVRSIRERVASGEISQYRIAKEYGLCGRAVSKIVRRESHKGVI